MEIIPLLRSGSALRRVARDQRSGGRRDQPVRIVPRAIDGEKPQPGEIDARLAATLRRKMARGELRRAVKHRRLRKIGLDDPAVVAAIFGLRADADKLARAGGDGSIGKRNGRANIVELDVAAAQGASDALPGGMDDDIGLRGRDEQRGDGRRVRKIDPLHRNCARNPREPRRVVADDPDDVMAGGQCGLANGRADETAGAGDEDARAHQAAACTASAAK